MAVRRTITVELEVEGPHAEPDNVVRWLRSRSHAGGSGNDWWIVGVELAPAVERASA